MDWFYDFIREILFPILGIILSALATKIGVALGKFWKEKITDSTAREVAKTCVSAVEMMYRELGGAEKLQEALSLSGKMLRRKGIEVDDEKMRVFLEAALAELKGAFHAQ